jgi:hypothetical protein
VGHSRLTWRDLAPYFLRLENYDAASTPARVRGGPVNVIDIPKPNPLVKRFLAATDSLGLPRCAISTAVIRKASVRARARSATGAGNRA